MIGRFKKFDFQKPNKVIREYIKFKKNLICPLINFNFVQGLIYPWNETFMLNKAKLSLCIAFCFLTKVEKVLIIQNIPALSVSIIDT